MKKAFLFALSFVFLLACGISNEQMTATAVMAKAQTQTAAPTRTSTVTATFTPKPTATPKPTLTSTPVPAAIGETVQYNNLEITLLEVVTHTQFMPSDYSGYDAKDGYIFIDITVLVRNRSDKAVKTTMDEMFVAGKDDETWYPFFGGFQTVELERRFNPMATIKTKHVIGNELISFEKDTYLRLVWPVHEDDDIHFGIQDSPQFLFHVAKGN